MLLTTIMSQWIAETLEVLMRRKINQNVHLYIPLDRGKDRDLL